MTSPKQTSLEERSIPVDFLGIGAQKAATTWLAFTLLEHPDIHIPKEKELHFWDLHFDRGAEAYAEFFNRNPTPQLRQGEFTPAYAILSQERIRAAYELLPHVRLIYSVRNPIERAWSAARMAIKDCGMELVEASDQWLIDHFMSKGSRNRGNYRQCLESWLEFFPNDQCLVLCYEELAKNPKQALIECCLHIGVDPSPIETLDEERLTQRIFAGPEHEIRSSVLPKLEDLYRSEMENFPDFLNSIGKTSTALQVTKHWATG